MLFPSAFVYSLYLHQLLAKLMISALWELHHTLLFHQATFTVIYAQTLSSLHHDQEN